MSAALAAETTPQRRPVLALLVAYAISQGGTQLTLVAIPWFVLLTTGSAARTGLVAFCELVPTILASFFGGALVDRIGHRRASIGADLISVLTVGAIPLPPRDGRARFLATPRPRLLRRAQQRGRGHGARGAPPRSRRPGRDADRARHLGDPGDRARLPPPRRAVGRGADRRARPDHPPLVRRHHLPHLRHPGEHAGTIRRTDGEHDSDNRGPSLPRGSPRRSSPSSAMTA